MNPLNIIRMNIRIIKVMNSCDRKQFTQLIDEMIDHPNVFRKRYYIWNIIRGRDYYKMLSYYVIQCLQSKEDEDYTKAETIIQMVMDTEHDLAVRKHFIWAIMKEVPLLTITTIQYASEAKILSLLDSNKELIVDDALKPFVDKIKELKIECSALNALSKLTEDS